MGNCHLKCFSAATVLSPKFNEPKHFDFTDELPEGMMSNKKTPRFGSKKEFALFSTTSNIEEECSETEEFYQNEHTPKTTQEMIAELSAALRARGRLENESMEILEIDAPYRKR